MKPAPRRLVLLGGGHAHLHVLQAFARQPLPGLELRLVSPHADLVYSGMVPGWMAGHYRAEQCRIALAPLAAAAGAHFITGRAVALDAAARRVTLGDDRTLSYQALSIDTGSVMRRDTLPGAREHAIFVRPIEAFVTWLPALLSLARRRVVDVAVVGGGAGGFELVLALQHRLVAEGGRPGRFSLVTGGPPPLAGYPAAVGAAALRVLAARGIAVHRERAAAVEPGTLVLAGGQRLPCDAPVFATGAASPHWLAGSGLALCEAGFVQTGATLQSASHPEVFAAGDVATRVDAPHPKSGVHAVRAGPPLAANLRAFVGGGVLQPYRPPQRTLNLLSCGERSAFAVWGGRTAGTRWLGAAAWWWKDRIDRAFIARFGGAR